MGRVTASPEQRRHRAGKSDGCCKVFAFDEGRVARVRSSMLSDAVVADVAEVFKVLANPSRVRIIRALAREELCVCDLSQILSLSVSATSHQLQAMRNARIVRYRMNGKRVYYSLRNASILALLENGIQHVTGGEDLDR